MGHATRMYDNQVGLLGPFGLAESTVFEQLSNLLAFVLVDLAAKSIDGKSPHNVIQCTDG